MKTKLVHEVRAVKSQKELASIVLAQRISERVIMETLSKLRTGITEIEIVDFIKKLFVKYKAPILAFEPIVAFGRNTAEIHHTEPTKAKLKIGDAVMFDFGTTINHYCSDMTRTYFWGKPSARQRRICLAVLEAQKLAIRKLSTGERRTGVVDRAVRKFFSRKKLDKKFTHRLGHGVGTVIHEWPNFGPKSEDILPFGCVMTVEPGLYFKDSFGVRIEDMVLITENGCRNLTKAPKGLEEITLTPQ